MAPALPVLLVRLLIDARRRHDEVVEEHCLTHLQRPTLKNCRETLFTVFLQHQDISLSV